MQGHDSWTHDSCELDHAPRETVGVRGETERVMADAMPMAYKTVQYVPGSSSSVAPLPLALALSLHSRTVRSIEHREMQSGGGPNTARLLVQMSCTLPSRRCEFQVTTGVQLQGHTKLSWP